MPTRVQRDHELEERQRALRRRNELSVADPTAPLTATNLLALQRSAGNQAVAQLVQSGGLTLQRQKKTDAELLRGPLPPVGDPDRDRAVRLRIARGQRKRSEEKRAASSWTGWFASFLPGTARAVEPGEEEDEEQDENGHGVGYGDSELFDEEGGASELEHEFGDKQPEEEPEPAKNPFAPSEIEIDLAKGSMERKGTSVGDVKAKAGAKSAGDGALKAEGSIATEGSRGKAVAKGSLLSRADGLEGEGKAEFLFGATGERKSSRLLWDIAGQRLEADGALEGFAGVKGGAQGKVSHDSKTGDIKASGKVGALIGTGTEGSVTVKLKSGGRNLGTATGKLGMHYGLGGEITGSVSWSGGTLSFSSGGKVIAGVGFSYGYTLELNTQALLEATPGWLSTLWSWLPDLGGADLEDLWV